MREIFKYSCLIFLYALSHSYLVTCFAIDLKIQGYQERYIGLGLSFFGVGVILGALSHYFVRKKFNLFTTIFFGSLIQLSFSTIFLFYQNPYLVSLMVFFMGVTNAINSLTLETYISSKFKKSSGFYISLFWSSAGLGAITGSLFIAINGINYLTYFIAILFLSLHFIPIITFRYAFSKIVIDNVSIRLTKGIFSKIK